MYRPTLEELQLAAEFREAWENALMPANLRLARDPTRVPDLELTNVLNQVTALPSHKPT